MFKKTMITALVAGGTLMSLPAFSQEGEGPEHRSEATVQALGSFVKDTTEGGVRQSATNSGGILSAYRFLFNANHGLEVNYGYSRNTQAYSTGSGSEGVPTNSHEISAAYVYRFPLKRITPFASAGVGGLVFDLRDSPSSNTQARAAFVYGAGADFNLTRRLFFRAQYRGLVYNSPTFDLAAFGPDRITHRAEPSAGIGFRF